MKVLAQLSRAALISPQKDSEKRRARGNDIRVAKVTTSSFLTPSFLLSIKTDWDANHILRLMSLVC